MEAVFDTDENAFCLIAIHFGSCHVTVVKDHFF